MKNIGISVIIAMYNTSHYIEECLESIKNQTFTDYELILVDDCSSDNTYEIAKSLIEEFPRAKLIKNPTNKGAGASRNIGLDEAKGKYLLFLDSDDFFESHMFEKMYTLMESTNADVVKCGFCSFNDQTKERKIYYEDELYTVIVEEEEFRFVDIKEMAFQAIHEIAWDKMFRTSFVNENEIRFQEQHNANDQLFVFKSLLLARSIVSTREMGTNWRRGVKNQLSKGGFRFPRCIFDATKETYRFLKKKGLFDKYRRSFNEYALDRLIQSIKMAREEDRDTLYGYYLKEGLLHLGMEHLQVNDFNSPFYYGKYLRFVQTNSISEILQIPKLQRFEWESEKMDIMLSYISQLKDPVLYGLGANGKRLYTEGERYGILWRQICDYSEKKVEDICIPVVKVESIMDNCSIIVTNPSHIGFLRHMINKGKMRVRKIMDCRAFVCSDVYIDECVIDISN